MNKNTESGAAEEARSQELAIQNGAWMRKAEEFRRARESTDKQIDGQLKRAAGKKRGRGRMLARKEAKQRLLRDFSSGLLFNFLLPIVVRRARRLKRNSLACLSLSFTRD
ncbi:hypothetical protein KM043_012660 [Ampulex compressa]|nr:hypothetical protein KM043_012660 [Ampulex compressa]